MRDPLLPLAIHSRIVSTNPLAYGDKQKPATKAAPIIAACVQIYLGHFVRLISNQIEFNKKYLLISASRVSIMYIAMNTSPIIFEKMAARVTSMLGT